MPFERPHPFGTFAFHFVKAPLSAPVYTAPLHMSTKPLPPGFRLQVVYLVVDIFLSVSDTCARQPLGQRPSAHADGGGSTACWAVYLSICAFDVLARGLFDVWASSAAGSASVSDKKISARVSRTAVDSFANRSVHIRLAHSVQNWKIWVETDTQWKIFFHFFFASLE